MTRILAIFTIVASLTAAISAARAQDSLDSINQQPMVPSPDIPQPRIMKRHWTMTPTPEQPGHPAPGQPEIDSSASAMTQDRYSPEQPSYGVHPSLGKKDPEAAAPATETIAIPKGDFAELRQGDTATVDQVIDPLRIQLKDKRIIQLVGIEIPDFNLENPGDISAAGMMYLKNLLEGKQVRLYQTRDNTYGRTNRLGYMLAHAVLTGSDETWVQGALLSAGLARVMPSERNPEMAAQMMKAEDDARTARRGLWRDPSYKVFDAADASGAVGQWAIVEGRVHATGTANNMVYLNFGGDWRSDFTIGLTTSVRREMEKAGLNYQGLSGKKVRVRGWVRAYNGPYTELLHPAWLEVLPEDPQSPTLPE